MTVRVSWAQVLAWRMDRHLLGGTWELDGGRVCIGWFTEGGRPPVKALRAEVARLASVVDRALVAEITRQ